MEQGNGPPQPPRSPSEVVRITTRGIPSCGLTVCVEESSGGIHWVETARGDTDAREVFREFTDRSGRRIQFLVDAHGRPRGWRVEIGRASCRERV